MPKVSILLLTILLLPGPASAWHDDTETGEMIKGWAPHCNCKRTAELFEAMDPRLAGLGELDIQAPVSGVDYANGIDAGEAFTIAKHWGPYFACKARSTVSQPEDQDPVWAIQIIKLGIVPTYGGHIFVHKQNGTVSFGVGPYAEQPDNIQDNKR